MVGCETLMHQSASNDLVQMIGAHGRQARWKQQPLPKAVKPRQIRQAS
jgi:hypothetical protein